MTSTDHLDERLPAHVPASEPLRIVPTRRRSLAPLFDLPDPPERLWLVGCPGVLERPSVAIVGARNATPTGRDLARRLARDLAGEGWLVVSGLARGIDAAAHEGALSASGASLGVLGTGIDVCYPRESRALYRGLGTRGLLMSEFAPGMPPLRHHFPRRNRIIAALSRAVVVVEGAARSGSRITADLALDLGREVLAVPRDPILPGAEMPNTLIRAGATPCTGADDVLSLFGAGRRLAPDRPRRVVPPRLEWLVLALRPEGVSVDDLQMVTGRSVVDILPALLDLQLRGVAERLETGHYRRVSD